MNAGTTTRTNEKSQRQPHSPTHAHILTNWKLKQVCCCVWTTAVRQVRSMNMRNASMHVYSLNIEHMPNHSMDTPPHISSTHTPTLHWLYIDYLSQRLSHINIFTSLFISAFIGLTFFLFVSLVLSGGEGEHSFPKRAVINFKQASPSHPPSVSLHRPISLHFCSLISPPIPSVITHLFIILKKAKLWKCILFLKHISCSPQVPHECFQGIFVSSLYEKVKLKWYTY